MGKWLKNSKKLIALFMTLMMMFALSLSVFADNAPSASMVPGGSSSSQSTTNSGGHSAVPVDPVPYIFRSFEVRASGTYEWIGGAWIKFYPETNSGSIELLVSVTFTNNGKTITLPMGTTWTYKISSFKDGGKITLKFDKANSPASAASIVKKYNMETMTGKIHKDSSKLKKWFWKIDCLGCGFYFRYN